MRLPQTEGSLAVLYILSIFLSLITLISTIVPWTHWWEILENCEESDVYCGCVLYAEETFNYFTGGKNVFCHFVVYATVPVLVTALVLGGYHGYRAWIVNAKSASRNRTPVHDRKRSGEALALSTFRADDQLWENSDAPCICWTPFAILAALLATLLFAQAVILSNGYRTTCHEYRKHLVKTLMASGLSANAMYDRIACDSVLDFMDYLEPYVRPFRPYKDRDKRYPFEAEKDRTRGHMINTSAALQFAIATTWLNWMVFIAIAVNNVVLARVTGIGVRCCF